ncbi:hypothetical protein K2173_008285 [Erythroxylum novogranatense]|uniref:Uncharacterized protein n=1 Tax=Erythroxylum novogranatense TaxID=1862640 RepID=A0AAV8U3E6_9ROSI|nr:hypothetical protein K2173_008285 [Erythroxylum novogranatense]
MSTLLDQQQQLQPPPQAYTTHGSHGSVGAFIAVLAVIIILGVIACMIGRLCSGRRILGFGEYDMAGWVERKCRGFKTVPDQIVRPDRKKLNWPIFT